MRVKILLAMLCVITQFVFGQLTSDTVRTKSQAQWGFEISSVADGVDFLGNYRRDFAYDPNLSAGVHLHTSTAVSAQLAFEYHAYRRTSDEHNNGMALFTGGVSFILFKTLVLGSGIYHFKSNEVIQRPSDFIVRGFYDGGGRTGAYYLVGLRAAIPINEDYYVPIGYYFMFGSADGGDGAWWYHGFRFGMGMKF
jgi:hypothetical protein